MTSDSELFSTLPGQGLVPLYEAKMIHQFDSRFATYTGTREEAIRDVTEQEKGDPNFRVRPRYWVSHDEVEARLRDRGWDRPWLLGWRDITNATNERTMIASLIPRVGVGHTISLLFAEASCEPTKIATLLAILNSLTLDYVARQKAGGSHLSYFLVKQVPVPGPDQLRESFVDDCAPRVRALLPSAEDSCFAKDLRGRPCHLIHSHDRATVRAELDALVAHEFGLNRDDLRFVLDPHERYDETYPSETFRVLKEIEVRQFGEYRTRRLVLEAWDRLIGIG